MRIKTDKTSYHRNGVSGKGFWVVMFTANGDADCKGRRFVGVVFDAPRTVAVFDVDMLAAGNIEFAKGNSWRGDNFEPHLRGIIHNWEESYSDPGEALEPEDTCHD